MGVFEVNRGGACPGITVRAGFLVTARVLRRVPLVQAIRTRRRWLAGLRSPYAWRASSFASLFRLSEAAFVTPVITAQTIWSSQRLIVLARLISSGMSSCPAHRR